MCSAWKELSVDRNERASECAALEDEIEKSVIEKATGQSKIEAARADLEEKIEDFQHGPFQSFKV